VSAPLAELAAGLLVTLGTLSGWDLAGTPIPAVHLVPSAELAQLACRGNCTVQGAYLPERGILLADSLDPLADPGARGVLLHELVHHVQHRQARYAEAPPCERYMLREREAYAIENRYRARIGLTPSYGLMIMMQQWSVPACEALSPGSSSAP
jgi:hypothetical protein